jgi:hypothetical protein
MATAKITLSAPRDIPFIAIATDFPLGHAARIADKPAA